MASENLPAASELPLKGAFLIEPKRFKDNRGDFFKLFTEDALLRAGIARPFKEEYVSISEKGVLRGLHYQSGAHSQAKLVCCLSGRVFDAIVDLRQSSPTFGKWHGITLSGTSLQCLYVPRGFAHGFLSLVAGSSVLYKADNAYAPEKECGIRYDDLKLGIKWPAAKPVLSAKDLSWPGFDLCVKFD